MNRIVTHVVRLTLKAIIAIILGLALLGGPASGAPVITNTFTTAQGFAIPQPGYQFAFPRDHGSHPEFKLEWWYITGHLWSPSQQRFGFQATFFRTALQAGRSTAQKPAPLFGTNELHLAHFALLDVSRGKYRAEERLNRDGWNAWARQHDLDVANGNWRLLRQSQNTNGPTLVLQGTILGEAELNVVLTPSKPLVLFGENGLSRKSAELGAVSYYLTYPRLKASGFLSDDGRQVAVEGQAWMDHEISSSHLGRHQVGWDWASIQLNDGREIMVYVMRTETGGVDRHSSLTWVGPGGVLTASAPDAFSWRPTRHWRSRVTGGNYPIEGDLKTVDPVSRQPVTYHLQPLADNQELVGKIGGISYWEGACAVKNSAGAVIGSAYLELTGYASSLQGRLE